METLAEMIAVGSAKTDNLEKIADRNLIAIDNLAQMIIRGSIKTENLSNDIESLAQMVANGFAAHDKRFDSIEGHLEALEKNHVSINSQVTLITKELLRHTDDIHEIKSSLHSLERSNLYVHEKLEKHDVRISRLELKTR